MEQFWRHVRKTDTCWEWVGANNGQGYGKVKIGGRKGRSLYAHRVSWEMANGRSIPPGMEIRHTCDNPPCVRPSHLLLGTRSDNMHDAYDRKRIVQPRKLTPRDFEGIRYLVHQCGMYHREVAAMFGVHPVLITNIANEKLQRPV